MKSNGLICFLLGVVITLLCVLVHNSAIQPAAAQSGAAGSAKTFGVAGIMGGTAGGILWVIDPENKQLAAYVSDGGRNIRWVGSRKILYDLHPKLFALNDATNKKYHPENMLKELDKLSKKKK